MNTLVLYYSYSGKSQKRAEEYAREHQLETCAVRDKKKPGMFKAFFVGCPSAISMKGCDIAVIDANLAAYDRIALFGPVWAGHPAPPVTAVLQALPEGTEVELHLLSGSGNSSAEEKVRKVVEDNGCSLILYENIKV